MVNKMVNMDELKRMIQQDLASTTHRIDALCGRADDLDNLLERSAVERTDILRRLAAVERSILPVR